MFRITKALSSLGSNLLHPGFPLSQMRPVSRAASAIFGLPSLSGVPFLRAFGTAKLTCITENTSVTKPIMVISETGSQLGVMTKEEALKIAKERKKDLVVVHYQDSKIVCKLQVLKSVEYQRKKKDQRSEFLNRKQSQEKEVRIKGKISPHDFQIKLEKINEFIEKDIKVKISFKEFVKLSPKDQDEDVKFSKEQYYQYHPEIKQLIDIVMNQYTGKCSQIVHEVNSPFQYTIKLIP